MGAEQIGNFLPVPRPPAQTLLGTCGADGCQVCSTGGHSALRWPPKCSDRVPPSPLASPSPLNPDPPNPRLYLTPGVELRELRSFVFPPGLSLLLWEMGPRAVPGPSPHPRRAFPLPRLFSYLFPAMSQLPRPRSKRLINNQLLLLGTSQARLQPARCRGNICGQPCPAPATGFLLSSAPSSGRASARRSKKMGPWPRGESRTFRRSRSQPSPRTIKVLG